VMSSTGRSRGFGRGTRLVRAWKCPWIRESGMKTPVCQAFALGGMVPQKGFTLGFQGITSNHYRCEGLLPQNEYFARHLNIEILSRFERMERKIGPAIILLVNPFRRTPFSVSRISMVVDHCDRVPCPSSGDLRMISDHNMGSV
jgi:hypothetical protein